MCFGIHNSGTEFGMKDKEIYCCQSQLQHNGIFLCLYVFSCVCIYGFVCTIFIRIEARELISYKWLLTRCIYEPLLHFTWAFISLRVLNPGVYLDPGIYISPTSIQINMVLIAWLYTYVHIHTHWGHVSILLHHIPAHRCSYNLMCFTTERTHTDEHKGMHKLDFLLSLCMIQL